MKWDVFSCTASSITLTWYPISSYSLDRGASDELVDCSPGTAAYTTGLSSVGGGAAGGLAE